VKNFASVLVIEIQNCRCFVGIGCTREDIVAQPGSDLHQETILSVCHDRKDTPYDRRLTFSFWSSGSGASIAV
jgi:hypothetical protein